MEMVLELTTSGLTLLTMWALAEKKRWGFKVGLLNQVCWLSITVMEGVWGLLPLTVAITWIYWKGLRKWKE